MNVFGRAARYGDEADPIGFFRCLRPGLDASRWLHGRLDTRMRPFPGEADRICDTVADLADTASGRTSRGLLPWISLMRGGGEPNIIEEWKRLVGSDLEARSGPPTLADWFKRAVQAPSLDVFRVAIAH